MVSFFRRKILLSLITGSAIALGLRKGFQNLSNKQKTKEGLSMNKTFPLDFQWPVQEPFLFCVHHNDQYPAGNEKQGLDPQYLSGRNLGQDFDLKDGFRMYHGQIVPGFPVHPHRGFETITIVRKGLVDHADSLGAAGRYGEGDVQWMTAGAGVQHSEMFPLLKKTEKNPLELFQIWLNLPKKSKMVSPHFKMFWAHQIPQLNLNDNNVQVQLIAGELSHTQALSPPPDSWAANPENEVLILLVKMTANSQFKLPASKNQTQRSLYFFSGHSVQINQQSLQLPSGIILTGNEEVVINNNGEDLEFLLLQALPINEPVVQYGPFVMNTKDEIIKTIEDYRKTQFGGWSWPQNDQVHGDRFERFAKYPDGKIERPQS